MSETILDSGERREAGTGSVRDVAAGKGRFDLTPVDIVGRVLGENDTAILAPIERYKRNGDTNELIKSLQAFIIIEVGNPYDYMIELSQHYERGCQKYGERNWEKGQPLSWYIDSGTRHYHKYKRGDTDERHDLAFGWNLICCIWTQEFHHEMIDLPFFGTHTPNSTSTTAETLQGGIIPLPDDKACSDTVERRCCDCYECDDDGLAHYECMRTSARTDPLGTCEYFKASKS